MCRASEYAGPRAVATTIQHQVGRAHAALASFFILSLPLTISACSSDGDSTSVFLRALAMALTTYSEVNGRLPYAVVTPARASLDDARQGDSPPSKPLYSWRVEMVYFLQAWRGEWCPSKTWDDQENHSLAELSCYFALTDSWRTGRDHVFPDTHVVAITGPETAFGTGAEQPSALDAIPPQTIIVVETRASGRPWPAPGDLDIGTMPTTVGDPGGTGISGRTPGTFHVIFADGQVWRLSEKTPFQILRRFMTIADAEHQDRDELLGPYGGRLRGPGH